MHQPSRDKEAMIMGPKERPNGDNGQGAQEGSNGDNGQSEQTFGNGGN